MNSAWPPNHTHTLLPSPLTPKRSAFEAWKSADVTPTPCKWSDGTSLPIPDSAVPPPGMQGALSLKQRRASSLYLQVLFEHCFSADYSKRFRPTAGDDTVCPCSFPPPDPQDQPLGLPAAPTPVTSPVASPVPTLPTPTLEGESVAVRHDPPRQQWWEPLMAEFLRSDNPSTPTPSPPPFRRRHRPPRHAVSHTAHHAVFVCPISASLHHDILGPDPSPLYLFHTDKGSAKLVTFLLASNSILRPLPPRPDPP